MQQPPKGSKKFIAKFKLCHNPYSFTMNSKGNLLKHLHVQLMHPKNLENHKNGQLKQLLSSQQTLHRDRKLIRHKLIFRETNFFLIVRVQL